jgi:hypothetical protein
MARTKGYPEALEKKLHERDTTAMTQTLNSQKE